VSTLRAILWDNDGVLVDTEPLFLQATRDALARVDIVLELAQYVEISLARGGSCFDLAAERGVSDDEIEELRVWRNVRYSQLLRGGVRVFEGVTKSITALHGRFPMAIVTSSNPEHFDEIHQPLGLVDYFEFVLTNGDYVRHKPHPEPYLRAAERLGLEPESCLVVEDTERGLDAALAAGMRCVVVPHELTRQADFRRAHGVLESLHDLPDAVERLGGC
jgi:HAD superfamily hydrolase (TIGR01509 family)